MKILKIICGRSRQLCCFKRMKKTICVEKNIQLYRELHGESFGKSSSLSDENSIFYTKNTIRKYFVIGGN